MPVASSVTLASITMPQMVQENRRDKLNDAKEEADTELADARKELTDGEF